MSNISALSSDVLSNSVEMLVHNLANVCALESD
jgi:hypothetical protein